MPKYYEQVTVGERQNSSITENHCLQDCKINVDCIQFVFYNSECYLKKKFNLLNAISSNYKNATVKSIKSLLHIFLFVLKLPLDQKYLRHLNTN